MERNFQLDWSSFVEEAIKRRKAQNLSQKRLAVLAGVSGPTVNSFENERGNVTLKSAFAILRTLGLMMPAR